MFAGHRCGDAVAHPRHSRLQAAEQLSGAHEVLPAGIDLSVQDSPVGEDLGESGLSRSEALLQRTGQGDVSLFLCLGEVGELTDSCGQGNDSAGECTIPDAFEEVPSVPT